MKIKYDKKSNSVSIEFYSKGRTKVEDADHFLADGLIDSGSTFIIEYDSSGALCSAEILDASKFFPDYILNDAADYSFFSKFTYKDYSLALFDESKNRVKVFFSKKYTDYTKIVSPGDLELSSGKVNLILDQDDMVVGFEILDASRILPKEKIEISSWENSHT